MVMIDAIRKRIRVAKADSVFVYWILESYEGIAAYSTLEFLPEDRHRDLELQIPPDFKDEVNALLHRLGETVYEL